MDIVIDLSGIIATLSAVATHNPIYIAGWTFLHGGFVVVLLIFYKFFLFYWVEWRKRLYTSKWDFTLLAIDIPRDSNQSPKAVENVFTQISGALVGIDWFDKYWKGVDQESFSFEIVSLEGYIQFLVRTPTHYRDLIESAIYAQHPGAEITEVEDYTDKVAAKFPDPNYELWGSDLILMNPSAYPLKSYEMFEHTMSQEFKDPMASYLEALSKLGRGEQFWMQIIIVPSDSSWKEGEEKIIKKLIGARVEHSKNFISKITDFILGSLREVANEIVPVGGGSESNHGDTAPVNLIQFLPPGEKNVIEAIGRKISKIGFKTKIRMIYVARKEVFAKARGVAAIFGALQQYTSLDLNGLKTASNTKTREAKIFFKKNLLYKRQNKILKWYKSRGVKKGATPYILNTEELATIYHFPTETVKVPSVRTVESKKAEYPVSLAIHPEDRGLGTFPEDKVVAGASEIDKKRVEEELEEAIFRQMKGEKGVEMSAPEVFKTAKPGELATRGGDELLLKASSSRVEDRDSDNFSAAPPANLPIE